MTIGTLTALAAYVQRLYSPLTDLASTRVDLLTALVSFDRVFEVLDRPPTIVDAPDAVALEAPRGRLDAEDVWFRYPAAAEVSLASLEADPAAALGDQPSDWILRGVTFTALPGQTIALVGPSGAGKTTLTSLIPRLYEVTKGSIRIDGLDVRAVTLESLTDAIGVVSQDPHLFHTSIADNLRYAKPSATDEELVEALHGGPDPRCDRRPPGGLRHRRRRARLPPLRWRETAALHRPGVAQGPGDRDPRRGDQPPRFGERGADPAGPGRTPSTGGPPSSSPTGCRPSGRPTRSWSWPPARSSSAAPTMSW